jgi:hypothetical protein
MPPKTHAAIAAFFFPPKAALFLSEVFEKSVVSLCLGGKEKAGNWLKEIDKTKGNEWKLPGVNDLCYPGIDVESIFISFLNPIYSLPDHFYTIIQPGGKK